MVLKSCYHTKHFCLLLCKCQNNQTYRFHKGNIGFFCRKSNKSIKVNLSWTAHLRCIIATLAPEPEARLDFYYKSFWYSCVFFLNKGRKVVYKKSKCIFFMKRRINAEPNQNLRWHESRSFSVINSTSSELWFINDIIVITRKFCVRLLYHSYTPISFTFCCGSAHIHMKVDISASLFFSLYIYMINDLHSSRGRGGQLV